MEKVCENCEWWDNFEANCDRVTHIDTEKGPKKFTIEMYSDDDQGLMATLRTGPKFGCIHFKPRKESHAQM